jgi:crotonobetainyl-CoA:carnitine CoA-transferase CaiB-like acyl-CoA transferase
VTGSDPAARHVRVLLRQLGATVLAEPAAGALITVAGDAAATAARDWAASGAMALTGRRRGPPLPAPGHPASATRGALDLLLALSRALHPAGPAPPPPAGPELPDAGVLGERAAIAGLRRDGPRSPGGAFRPVPTRDGWLGLSLPRPDDLELLPALLAGPLAGPPTAEGRWRAVADWAADLPTAAAVDRARLLGLAAGPIAAAGTGPAPAAPAPFSVLRGGARRRPARPLVVDLTGLWAGPLCAQLLGQAGARVVKVESTSRPDGTRGGPAAFFDLLHAGHESVVLDLGTPGGRDALGGLAAAADVVLEASRPRALRRLGLRAEELVAAGTIWTSITAYGRGGPGADWVGFGDDVAAAAGLVAWDGGIPLPCGDAIADPLAGVHAAVATVAALHDDAAHLLDVSMHRVAAGTLDQPPGAAAGVPPPVTPAPVTVAPPRARRARRRGPRFGEHTRAVLDELGVRP